MINEVKLKEQLDKWKNERDAHFALYKEARSNSDSEILINEYLAKCNTYTQCITQLESIINPKP